VRQLKYLHERGARILTFAINHAVCHRCIGVLALGPDIARLLSEAVFLLFETSTNCGALFVRVAHHLEPYIAAFLAIT
jgi:hypothetical protein